MSNNFERISDIPELEAEEHYTLLTSEKLWLFSRKFHDQTNFHSGQRVTHKGGYSLYFDLKSKKWSEIAQFNNLTTEEHVDELIFVHEDRICCLLYTNFGKIEFLQLAVFDVNERQFTMWNQFDNSSKLSIKASEEDETFKQNLILADGILPDKSRLLIASIEGNLHLFKLSINFSSKQASLSPAATYSEDVRGGALLIPINAAVQNSTVILEYSNRASCAVRWESSQLDKFSVDEINNFERIEIKGDTPRFQFNGARLVLLIKENEKWLHFGGNIQKGMTGREFNGEVWSLEKAFSKNPEWKKLEGIEIPKAAENAEFAYDTKTKTLFVIDPKNGLFNIKIDL